MDATRHKIFPFFFLLISLIVPIIAQASPLPSTTIEHNSAPAFTANERLLLNARLYDSTKISIAQCYFKTASDKNYLYVTMEYLSGNTYQCVLPALAPGSQTLEYFFLLVNKNNQIIRTMPYIAQESIVTPPADKQPALSADKTLDVYAELENITGEETAIIDDQVNLLTITQTNQLYGLRAGIYQQENIPDHLNAMPGYFGGFVLDRTKKKIRPVKGFAPNLHQENLRDEAPGFLYPKGSAPALKSSDPPDISGVDWTGYYTRSDITIRQYLTASISQSGSSVTIITTKSDLGHNLSGTINSDGDMLLYDSHDGEDWTTHYGPATTTTIKIYDYAAPPEEGIEVPPLNKIILYRSPQPPASVTASDGTFPNKVALHWTPSPGAASYVVYNCSSPSTDSCTTVAHVFTAQYEDIRDIASGTYYRITACNEFVCSDFSDYDSGYLRRTIAPFLHLLL